MINTNVSGFEYLCVSNSYRFISIILKFSRYEYAHVILYRHPLSPRCELVIVDNLPTDLSFVLLCQSKRSIVCKTNGMPNL